MNIIISNASPEPIYRQISEQIKALIINNELSAGDLLPSIRSMARDLRVSVIITKRAYEVLEEEGFIDSVQGKGCFVSHRNKELLKEIRLKTFEDLLLQVIEEGRKLNLTLEDIFSAIRELNKEEV